MGTNFYWKTVGTGRTTLANGIEIDHTIDRMDPVYHIGKRSAAGLYCWSCRVSLCREGESQIHYGGGPQRREERWYDACPKCGRKKGGRDLDAETGVGHACSFTWAQIPHKVRRVCEERPQESLIEDEYDRSYTGEEFLKELRFCPIVFTDSIGRFFS